MRYVNLDSLAKIVLDRRGKSIGLTHRQAREVLRLLGEVLRGVTKEDQQKLFALLVLGNAAQLMRIDSLGGDLQ